MKLILILVVVAGVFGLNKLLQITLQQMGQVAIHRGEVIMKKSGPIERKQEQRGY